MIPAKYALPSALVTLACPILQDHVARYRSIFLSSPPGYFIAEGLVGALSRQFGAIFWLRLGKVECDPGTLFLSIIECVHIRRPDFGLTTQKALIARPGPVFGWPALFHSLAEEFNTYLAGDTVLVLENADVLKLNQPVLHLLGQHFLNHLQERIKIVLVSPEQLPQTGLPENTHLVGFKELRVGLEKWRFLSPGPVVDIPTDTGQRLVKLFDGQEGALRGILAACEVLGVAQLSQILERTRQPDRFLAELAKALLAMAEPEMIAALALTLKSGYGHPLLFTDIFGSERKLEGPWLQVLEGDWLRMLHLWVPPLQRALGRRLAIDRQHVRQAASFFVEHQARLEAIQMLVDMDDFRDAAMLLSGECESMLDRGQWSLLLGWIERIPPAIQHDYANLVFGRAEILAASGRLAEARRYFSLSAELYTRKHDPPAACRSLVEQSVLAGWDAEIDQSVASVLSAQKIGNEAHSKVDLGWAAWQMGCLDAETGSYPAALVHFTQASETIQDASLVDFFVQVKSMLSQLAELQRQSEEHRLAYLQLKQAETELDASLKTLATSPIQELASLLETHGWSNLPLNLKLPAPELPARLDEPAGFLQKLRLLRDRPAQARPERLHETPQKNIDIANLPGRREAIDVPEPGGNVPARVPALVSPVNGLQAGVGLREPTHQPEPGRLAGIDAVAATEQMGKPGGNPTCSAYLLGDFRVLIDGKQLDSWPGSRSMAVLKYLLSNPRHEIPRDVLMDKFWPETDPKSARNNLNVALYKLRQAFSAVSRVQVIVFDQENYSLNPDLFIWTDIEEFENHNAVGRRLEKEGEFDQAIKEYVAAYDLYKGDFLAKDPYADWAINTRERLRILFLEALNRLSRIYFRQGDYESCILFCQRILEYDNCREDIHCLLMRCYGRQGQFNLAIRQYQTCVDILRTELEVEPAEATVQLFEKLRKHEQS